MLSATIDVVFQRLERLIVNSISSSANSLSCEICGSIDHLTVNRQVGSLFAEDTSDSVNYGNTYNPRLTNDLLSNIIQS